MDALMLQQRRLLLEVFPASEALEQSQLRVGVVLARFGLLGLDDVRQMTQFRRRVLVQGTF